ncbi:hypothetical protein DMC47_01115 [Nostoc sp. 3335mG]|nr:hypothetical protein DMC47_01115 [Nostoc sp. 3335mG]
MTGPWDDFAPAKPAPRRQRQPRRPDSRTRYDSGTPTGEAYDGDTFRLDTGADARMLGYDAFERRQTARDVLGGVVPIGDQSRKALLPLLPGGSFTPTGTQSYGRPVGVLESGNADAGAVLLRQGMGLAAPDYLRNDPVRLGSYMEAERLARLNRTGVHSNSYVPPTAFRRGTTETPPAARPKDGDGPWASAEWSDEGGAAAVFADDPTPFQGLRQDIADGYIALTNDPNSTVDQIVGYGTANGFKVDRKDAERFVRQRAKGVPSSGKIEYKRAPRVLTDPGDGTFGAAARGFADPLNVLDEAGALVDSLGGTDGRESILNSDRRWADIYANNLDQNRSILANDDAAHPYARFGGQLASGLAIPGASIEGVGLNAARATLRAGGTRMAAVAAAESAVRRRLAIAGSAEAGAAGAGAAEGGLVDRAKNAAIYAPVGAALGYGTAGLAQRLRGLLPPLRSNPRALVRLQDDTAEAAPVDPRSPDRLDLSLPASDRARDRIDVPAGQREPAADPVLRLDTSPPDRPAPAARTLDDVMGDIEAWVNTQGGAQSDGGTLPGVMLHGSPYSGIDEFDPYGRSGYGLFGMGTYLTDNPRIAAQYSAKGLSRAAKAGDGKRTVYAVEQSVQNPIDMDGPADRATWEKAARAVLGDWSDEGYFNDLPDGASNERYWREIEDYLTGEGVTASEGAETMDAFVRSLGHDGITHIGGGRVGDGTRHRVVIALDPEQTTIRDRLALDPMLQPPAPRSPDWIDVNARRPAARERDVIEPTTGPWDEFGPAPMAAADDAGPWDDFAAVADDVADMANETPRPTLDGPRVPDRIDPRPIRQPLADMPDGERLAAAAQLNSRDMLPLPANTVRDMDEAARIEAGRYQTVRAPNEAATLGRRNLPSPNDGTRTIPKRGPVDLVTWARTQGGLRDDGGDLAQLGMTNAPRNGMDFASGEQRFGKLVADDGLDLDQAALRAWEDGYFPDHVEPPTRNEFIDALAGTHRGGNRVFHPDDFAEVDAFEAARAQRLDVEAAQAEGAPLTLDRDQPVGPDDLDANAPPVRAYEEWGENAPDLAGNIRLDKLDSPQAIGRALAETDRMVGGFDAAKRGRITQAETKALAEDLGMTADDLLQRRKGQAFNAEQALAARQLLARSATDLVNMAKRIARTQNPGDEAEAAFREAWLRHAAIQEQVAGMTAEAGRLLQQFRMTADSRDATQALSSIGDILGGSGRLKDVAERIVDLEQVGTSPAGINQFALKSLSAKWKDMATEFYINSLLSGPQTHAVNILSNTLTSLAQLPEHLAAAGIGAARKALPGQADTDRVLFSEFGARAAGMIAGAREGVRAAARSFLTGESSDAITKVETQQLAAIPGPVGSVIRTPTRLLTAEDELFKGIARRMELGGLAVRQAAKEGLSGAEARDRAADLVLNPTDDMLRKAFEYARYLTFQTPLDHGSMAAGLSAGLQRRPEFKLFIPFVRTPVNLLKFAAERSPVAPLMKSWRKEFSAGGPWRDMAVARMALGTGLGAMMYEMAAAGHITGGGPADADARKLMQANGWQPYSLKVGDQYYSYQRFDPFSTTIGTVADMVDLQTHMTDKEKEKSATLVGAAILNNLSNKTWLSGISSGLEAINDPARYLEGFLSRTAGAIAVPSIAAQLARVNDPILREARSPIDRIRSRIPGLSSRLPPRRNVFGEPMQAQNVLGPDIVSPVWTSTGRNDPTIDALLAAGVSVSAPQRSYTAGGKRVEWTPQQYDALQAISGRIAKPALDSLTRTGDWLMMDEDAQKDAVRDVLRDARKEAKASVLSGATPRSGPWDGF